MLPFHSPSLNVVLLCSVQIIKDRHFTNDLWYETSTDSSILLLQSRLRRYAGLIPHLKDLSLCSLFSFYSRRNFGSSFKPQIPSVLILDSGLCKGNWFLTRKFSYDTVKVERQTFNIAETVQVYFAANVSWGWHGNNRTAGLQEMKFLIIYMTAQNRSVLYIELNIEWNIDHWGGEELAIAFPMLIRCFKALGWLQRTPTCSCREIEDRTRHMPR